MLEPRLISRIHHLKSHGLSIGNIAKRLGMSRNTVRKYLRNIALSPGRNGNESSKLLPCYDCLAKLIKEDPSIPPTIAFRIVSEKGFDITQMSVTAFLSKHRDRGASAQHRKMRIQVTTSEILRCMTAGKSYLDSMIKHLRGSADSARFALTEKERAAVIQAGRQGQFKKWRYGVAIDISDQGISAHEICKLLSFSRNTLRRIMAKYRRAGLTGVFHRNSLDIPTDKQKTSQLKAKLIMEILHRSPNSFGINRTSWTQPLIAKVYESIHGQRIGASTVGGLIRDSGYSFRKARRVLTSPDPDYAEKVEALLSILHRLRPDEDLFFLDEFGPRAVKKYGGRLYLKEGHTADIPKNQSPRGSVTLSAALSATTNQLYWIYSKAKDTRAIIELIEVLYNRLFQKSRIYITWDAASWHGSNELVNWLDSINAETVRLGTGPCIEFVPLPSSSQFLNVIESVFSSMARAVIHHSDYGSEKEMKTAISRHFVDRNLFFERNPRRAGKKIWEIDFFSDFKNLRAGDYREW